MQGFKMGQQAMITEDDKKTVEAIKQFIDQQTNTGETIDWSRISWFETLDRMVHNLEIAEQSYRICSKEDKAKNFYTAKCGKCGWFGSSRLLLGGGQIADTGDYGDAYCPVCDSTDIDNEMETRPKAEEYVDREVEDIERFVRASKNQKP